MKRRKRKIKELVTERKKTGKSDEIRTLDDVDDTGRKWKEASDEKKGG